jgi:chemotaxis signal transduction protein
MLRNGDVRHVERAGKCASIAPRMAVSDFKLGGQHVPVFALDELFGRTSAHHRTNIADGHIAVTGHRNALTGWLVDRIARAAQPGPGDIAPLPPIVGAPATTWFEGVVWLDENESALLIAPHRLTSRRPP